MTFAASNFHLDCELLNKSTTFYSNKLCLAKLASTKYKIFNQ